ncbi:MAG: DUF2190 family protein [Pseudomonadota bacterium]
MKNFIQPGDVLTVAAPTGGVVSGGVVLINKMLGIAAFDAAEAAEVEVAVAGVFEVPKKSTDAPAVGALLYWDTANGEMTTTASGNTKAGYAAEAAGSGATVVKIRLTPGVG